MKRALAVLLLVIVVAFPALAAEGGEDPGGDTLTTVFKWINFITVFGALGWLLRKPMREFFTGQRAAIQAAINEGREASRQAEQRMAEIESTGRAARLELRAYAARLAVNLAEQRIRQRLTPDTHAALFDTFVRGLRAPQAGGRA